MTTYRLYTWLPGTDVPVESDIDFNFVSQAFFTAKGDLISATASDTPVIIPVGPNDYVFTADSSLPAGVGWKAPSSGTQRTFAFFTL